MSTDGPRYPHQQLRSVSLETFFPGRLSVYPGLDRIQEEFQAELPHLLVPNAVEGTATALRPIQLRDDRQTEALAAAVNQVTYISFDYPGHHAFIDRAMRFLPAALNHVRVAELNRVIYRYENEIGITGQEGILPVHRIISLDAASWTGLREGATAIDFSWQRKWSKGEMLFRVAVEKRQQVDVLLITIAAAVIPAGSVEGLRDMAVVAHDEAVDTFEAMITDEFRETLLGDTGDDDDE